MAKVLLSGRAREDLKDIGRYTQKTWGVAQRDQYLGQIAEAMAALADGRQSGVARNDLRPGLCCYPVNRHFIFFRRTHSGTVDILRILHDRMDSDRHL